MQISNSSTMAEAGSGGGAGGHALQAWNPGVSYSTYKFDEGAYNNLKSAGSYSISGTNSTGPRSYAGKGVKGYGGGGGGGALGGYNGHLVGFGADGGANGHFNANGRSAADNTGGGGGGTATNASVQHTGGNGGSGICIIKWWTE
jgi:hypothetical protein